jgi:hypothetical protein
VDQCIGPPDLLRKNRFLQIAKTAELDTVAAGRDDEPLIIQRTAAGRPAHFESVIALRAPNCGATRAHQRVVEVILGPAPLTLNVHRRFPRLMRVAFTPAPASSSGVGRLVRVTRRPDRLRVSEPRPRYTEARGLSILAGAAAAARKLLGSLEKPVRSVRFGPELTSRS